MWTALEEQGVPLQYVQIFRRVYEGQTRVVVAKRESRAFRITRGTKQGDPGSLPLFNAVLEKVITKIKAKWLGWGIRVGPYPGDLLQNLRFADDIILLAKSIKVLRRMLEDLRAAAGEVGLELYMGKTKIFANSRGRKHRRG